MKSEHFGDVPRLMKFRSSIFASLLFAYSALIANCPSSNTQTSGSVGKTASITVLVRSRSNAPVPNLTANDFIVSEHGWRNSVSAVENLVPTTHENLLPTKNVLAVDVLLIIAP